MRLQTKYHYRPPLDHHQIPAASFSLFPFLISVTECRDKRLRKSGSKGSVHGHLVPCTWAEHENWNVWQKNLERWLSSGESVYASSKIPEFNLKHPFQEAERPILTIAPGDPKSQPPWTPTNMSHTHKDPQIHIIKNKFEKKRQEADREAGWGASVTLESSPEMPTFSSHLALPEISTTSPDGLSAGFHIGNHDKLTVFVS